jgi:hypothetical protein
MTLERPAKGRSKANRERKQQLKLKDKNYTFTRCAAYHFEKRRGYGDTVLVVCLTAPSKTEAL